MIRRGESSLTSEVTSSLAHGRAGARRADAGGVDVADAQVALAALLDHPDRAVGEHVDLARAVRVAVRRRRLVVGPGRVVVGERLVRDRRRRRRVEDRDVVAGADVGERVVGVDRARRRRRTGRARRSVPPPTMSGVAPARVRPEVVGSPARTRRRSRPRCRGRCRAATCSACRCGPRGRRRRAGRCPRAVDDLHDEVVAGLERADLRRDRSGRRGGRRAPDRPELEEHVHAGLGVERDRLEDRRDADLAACA